MKKPQPSYYPGIILLLFFIVISLLTYQDYGVAWDESIQRDIGKVSYDYIFNGDNKLDIYLERDHGVGFELILLFVEKAVKAQSFRDIFLARHLASNIFFLSGAFSLYVLSFRLFKKQWLAILAFLMIVLSPRLYAHSFFNSKDTPLLAMYAISFMMAEWAFRKDKAVGYWILGLCVGYATSIRILGIYLFGWLFLFLLIDIFIREQNKKIGNAISNAVVFIAGAATGVYVFWPTLWKNPVANFIECYKSLSHFRWDGLLLLNGETLQSTHLPWYYLPEWFAITTPVVWPVLGFAGLILLLVSFLKSPLSYLRNTHHRHYLLYIACFLGPVAVIILLHSVVYDDWRHVYFIYPAFVMLVLYVLDKISVSRYKYAGALLVALQLILILVSMLRIHPFHQVYFNELISHKEEYLRKNFDYDYWGSSYKQALTYIMKTDKRDVVKIATPWEPIDLNISFLEEYDKARVQSVGVEDAEYFLTNFRYHPQDYNYPTVYYEAKVQNSTVVRVYKLK